MQWKKDSKYTIIGISEMIATTHKTEIKVMDLMPDGMPIFVFKGKRTKKVFTNNRLEKNLIFEGWDIELKCDWEISNTFSGNACYNFANEPTFIRAFIEKNNLNENFSNHEAIISVLDGREVCVYPEIETNHAVVKRIRAKCEAV